MKLRSKTLLFSSLILIILVGVLLSISYLVFQDTYSGIETKYSYHVLNDELTDLNNTIYAMNQTTQDWAQWDDAYTFISGNNPSFISKDVPNSTFSRLNLNLIIYVNNNGTVMYGKAYNLETKQFINLPQNLTSFTNDSPLLTHNLTGVSGILNLKEGPMIITTQPVITSHGQGPIKGTLIMGRFVNTGELKPLINIQNGTLSVTSYNTSNQPSDVSKILPTLSKTNPTNILRLGPNSIAAYTLINDIYGNPAMIIKSQMPRTLYNSYIDTILYFIITIVLCGMFFVGLVIYSLDKNVLNRLDKIMGEIKDIGKKGDLKRRITVTGNDELSDLASSINNTVHALQKSERNLEESENKYRNIFENTGTAMLIADEDMTISLVNKTFENILKRNKEDIEGKLNWIDMLIPDDRKKIENLHKSHKKGDSNVIIPKTYEAQANIKGTTKDFFATFDFIPGTRKSLISLIDITDRKKAERLLTTSLKEKELLLREIHHRVKNSLQLISSLLSLQASEIDDDEIIARYKESENRIHTIALIHESLYQSTNISNINFQSYVEVLIEDIINSYNINTNKIKTTLELGNYNLGIETAIPVGLIINELVSNSLKHAFNGYDKGEIKIILEKNMDTYTLTVKDNGIGLPDGFNYEETSSLGILLINSLVNQIEGKMTVKVNGGTMVIIEFTELEYRERM